MVRLLISCSIVISGICPIDSSLSQVFFRFVQIERWQVQVAGDSCMETALISYYFVCHP